MQLLKKRILQDGKCYEGGILKVDGFIIIKWTLS